MFGFLETRILTLSSLLSESSAKISGGVLQFPQTQYDGQFPSYDLSDIFDRDDKISLGVDGLQDKPIRMSISEDSESFRIMGVGRFGCGAMTDANETSHGESRNAFFRTTRAFIISSREVVISNISLGVFIEVATASRTLKSHSCIAICAAFSKLKLGFLTISALTIKSDFANIKSSKSDGVDGFEAMALSIGGNLNLDRL